MFAGERRNSGNIVGVPTAMEVMSSWRPGCDSRVATGKVSLTFLNRWLLGVVCMRAYIEISRIENSVGENKIRLPRFFVIWSSLRHPVKGAERCYEH